MPVVNISNGVIQEITSDRRDTFVTVAYMTGPRNRRTEQTVRMVVGPRTVILNERGNPVSASALRVGMTINAVISAAMTRSIPPQSNAFMIQIVRSPRAENIVVGNVLDIDRRNRSFTTINDRDRSTIIRFNVSESTRFFDRSGRPMEFSRLMPGMRVRVRHADFMTASIPPQTTALEVRVL